MRQARTVQPERDIRMPERICTEMSRMMSFEDMIGDEYTALLKTKHYT